MKKDIKKTDSIIFDKNINENFFSDEIKGNINKY
jgi:hypothetical protein